MDNVRRVFRSYLTLFLVFFLVFESAGCGSQWKRKFIRKRKNAEPPQAVLVLESNFQSTYPPEVRYREHFAFWKSWHTELLVSLGQSRKRDIRYLDGTIGELRSMVEILPPSSSQANRLRAILGELGELQNRWGRSPDPWRVSPVTRSQLEKLRREIDKSFHYSRVKTLIPSKEEIKVAGEGLEEKGGQ